MDTNTMSEAKGTGMRSRQEKKFSAIGTSIRSLHPTSGRKADRSREYAVCVHPRRSNLSRVGKNKKRWNCKDTMLGEKAKEVINALD